MGALPTSRLMTVAEFELFAEQSDKRLELINGDVVEQDAPKFRHQRMQARLFRILRSLVPEESFVCMELQFRPAPEFTLLQPDARYLPPIALLKRSWKATSRAHQTM